MNEPIRIMSVDDNELVRQALERRFTTAEGFAWCGGLPGVDGLLDCARDWRADLILLDLEMPGPDPLVAISLLARGLPRARVVVLSGSVTPSLVSRALGAGASGYLSKGDEGRAMVEVAQQVAAGQVAIGPEVRTMCGPLSAVQRQVAGVVTDQPRAESPRAPRDRRGWFASSAPRPARAFRLTQWGKFPA